ncbi:bifunctional transcriptional activator/DNA repair enzyme AdaA [Zophobihabitans entericus]|uniref:Methylated-DNA--protein-cysteine methyltransferase n=1 Tax=Zophobihabitans entericus TaxID=1635327 RepID=A0A6G9I990_9GAMM|nr:methylated-DNA--[protein]-cysteine S-methyltransferase [Zophobihabitans entericus]QIQ20399.1 methylated-DNA--[protein]-cysteine S-methyltransferase [Zophobihabitans entericus]
MKLTDDIMYKALVEKDPAFEGVFFAGIKTTGIFCRPTCSARKPKSENVEYFADSHEAILKGYRPCKICKPQRLPDETPAYIESLLAEIEEYPDRKIKDADLEQKGIEPHTVRRWFIKHHGMTFQAYQRTYRINSAFKKIQEGGGVLDSAYDNGFESLSGFNDSFKAIFGVSPSKAKEQNIINLMRLETPIGTMFAGATDKGICLLEFTDRKSLETELKFLTKRFNAVIVQGKNAHIDTLKAQLAEYFIGKRRDFDVSLDTAGTEFQEQVWQVLRKIPYGELWSYQQEANLLGKPKAVRAVANANGMNRMSIIIPCHRVIGSDGKLTGYGGGLWRKNWLLELEKKYKSV